MSNDKPAALDFRKKWFEYFLLILGMAFTIAFFVTLKIHFDNTQILDKAFTLIDTGVWTHHGNAGTGVGFVPGSFMTAITALPMKIYFSPYSAMAVLALFHLIAYFLMAQTVTLAYPLMTLDFLLIFWLNPWRVEQSELYNPGYLFLFSALHFWTSMRMQKPHFWLSVLHVLCIGFCAQLHYSFVILGALSLLLFYYRWIKVSWTGVLAGIGLVLLSLIPYFIESFNDPALKVVLNRSSGSFLGINLLLVYPVFKSVGYWFRYGSTYFARHIFSEINFLWVTNETIRSILNVSFKFLMYPIALVSFFISLRVYLPWLKENFSQWSFARPAKNNNCKADLITAEFQKLAINKYAFYMFISLLIASMLSPVEFNHWHLILCFPIVSVMTCIYFHEFRQKWSVRNFRYLFASILLYFCVHNAFAALGSRSHSIHDNYARDVRIYYQKTHPNPRTQRL